MKHKSFSLYPVQDTITLFDVEEVVVLEEIHQEVEGVDDPKRAIAWRCSPKIANT